MGIERHKDTQHDGTTRKAFVNTDGQTTLVCPECSGVKVVTANQFRGRQHTLKVRCSCSNVFSVNLDFRQNYRKNTELEGTFDFFPPAVGGGKADILNLSLTGICIRVQGSHTIHIGDKGRINFTLDNRKKTHLVRQFKVCSVRGNVIGCEFKEDHAYAKELGFYLRFGP